MGTTKGSGRKIRVRNCQTGVTKDMTQQQLQGMFKKLKDADATVAMTASAGKKFIANATRNLYEF